MLDDEWRDRGKTRKKVWGKIIRVTIPSAGRIERGLSCGRSGLPVMSCRRKIFKDDYENTSLHPRIEKEIERDKES
jgi:hypothetical protein